MKVGSKIKAVSVFFLALTLSGCAASGFLGAAQTQGQIQAGVSLPDWPPECTDPIPHAALQAGMEARSVLKRERAQLDLANLNRVQCGDLYGRIQSEFGAPVR